MKLIYSLAILMCVTTFLTCTVQSKNSTRNPKELDRFVDKYDYTPITVPRNGDGPGTLVTFKRKNKKRIEATVARQATCFTEGLEIDSLRAALPSYSFSITSSDSALIDPSGLLGSEVDLTLALNEDRVESIEVNFTGVHEVVLERIDAQKKIALMQQNPTSTLCVEALLNKRNYMIERGLVAESISISFKTSSESNISLDADLLGKINLDASRHAEFQGKSSLIHDEYPLMIGYRLWQIEASPGSNQAKIELDSVGGHRNLLRLLRKELK